MCHKDSLEFTGTFLSERPCRGGPHEIPVSEDIHVNVSKIRLKATNNHICPIYLWLLLARSEPSESNLKLVSRRFVISVG